MSRGPGILYSLSYADATRLKANPVYASVVLSGDGLSVCIYTDRVR